MRKNREARLPVRKRHILAGDGESTTARTVLCPTYGEAVALSVCGECLRCERIDGDGVTCQPETTRPTMRWAPMLRRILPSAGDRVAIAEVMSRDVTCVTSDVSVEASAWMPSE